jgi:uncharacterized protein with ParB-like and HNH nuclease domain
MKKDVKFENITSENDDDYSDDSLFNIMSWGADLSFREIISMYDEDELVKPELQRKYVWDKKMASRFVESVLLGLPVPSVFFAQSGSQKLIVDGYQRIMTIYDYVNGVWSGDGKVFRLVNSQLINDRWRNKSFSELTKDDQRRIRSTTIHAIIFEQKKPENDDTSLYQIFERINTSGKILAAQEIRNCVYQGSLNDLLFELNKDSIWRKLYGSAEEDSRMRDLECILRFFALKPKKIRNSSSKQISLKKTLNEFMGEHKNVLEKDVSKLNNDFLTTIYEIDKKIGKNAFRNSTKGKFSSKFHPAVYDAIAIATYDLLKQKVQIPMVSEEKHLSLLKNVEFQEAVTKRTTDIENINKRIEIVKKWILEEYPCE